MPTVSRLPHQLFDAAEPKVRTLLGMAEGLGWRRTLALSRHLPLGERPCTITLRDGTSHHARIGKGQTDLQTLLDVWVSRSYHFEGGELDPRWIVDAGANVGYATRWFAERYPKAHVIAIEPDDANFHLLEANTAHLTNVTRLQAGLAATAEPRAIFDAGRGSWGFRVGDEAIIGEHPIGSIDCVTVEDLIERHGIDRVGILKIDIEGGEREVMAASAPWIDRVDLIAIELHDRKQPGCTRAFMDATRHFEHERLRGDTYFVWRAAAPVAVS